MCRTYKWREVHGCTGAARAAAREGTHPLTLAQLSLPSTARVRIPCKDRMKYRFSIHFPGQQCAEARIHPFLISAFLYPFARSQQEKILDSHADAQIRTGWVLAYARMTDNETSPCALWVPGESSEFSVLLSYARLRTLRTFGKPWMRARTRESSSRSLTVILRFMSAIPSFSCVSVFIP